MISNHGCGCLPRHDSRGGGSLADELLRRVVGAQYFYAVHARLRRRNGRNWDAKTCRSADDSDGPRQRRRFRKAILLYVSE